MALTPIGGFCGVGAVAPTLSSATINSAATTLTLVFSENVNCSSSAGLTLTDSTQSTTPALTYSSGTGSTTLVFTLGSTVYSGDTCTLAYVASSGNIVATTGGAPLANFSGTSVTNNSTVTTPYFQTGSYTGTGTAQNISLPIEPDLVIIFNTSGGSEAWPTFDSSNGPYVWMDWANGASKSGTDTDSLAITSSGFSLGNSGLVNASGNIYQYFAWKKAANFFDIQQYTGNATNRTISHNLTSTPFMINSACPTEYGLISGMQNIESSNPWDYAYLLGNDAIAPGLPGPGYWNNTPPTTTHFTVGTGRTNENDAVYTTYLFGSGSGSNSAFGTYTGNGSTSGPSVSGLGFTPTCVMIMQQNSSGNNWRIVYNNSASGEMNLDTAYNSTNFINLVSGGFNVVTTNADFNTNSAVYQYMAWA